jgi:hypothetical protein
MKVAGGNILLKSIRARTDNPLITARGVAPREASPYGLLSRCDMEQFSAGIIFWAGGPLEALKTDCVLNPPGSAGEVGVPIAIFHQPLDERTRETAVKRLRMIEKECYKIGLEITAKTIAELIGHIENRPSCD